MKRLTILTLSVFYILTAAILCFSEGVAEGKAANYADVIYYNGIIYTVDKDFSTAEAVAVKNGRFLAVGSMGDVAVYEGPATEKIDLKGLTVIPGLMDSHIHFDLLGLILTDDDQSSWPESVQDWLDIIAMKVAEAKPGEWISLPKPYGFEDKLTAKVIDTVSPDNPVFMSFADHSGLVNSKALEIAGISKGVKIEGGAYSTDENGEPTGYLYAAANMRVKRYCPEIPAPVEIYKNALRAAMKEVNKFGITSIIQQGVDFNSIRAYQELADAGEMTVRASVQYWESFHDWVPIKEIEERIKRLSFITPEGMGDEWFKVDGIKALYDGPVSMYDFDDHRFFSQERFNQIAEIIAKYGMRLGVHVCGDRAIDHYLDASEYANSKYPIDKSRWFLIHNYFPTPDDYPRIKKLGMVAVSQPMFMHSQYSGYYVKNDPNLPYLESICHPFKSELEAGIPLGFGSDYITNTYDPFVGIWIAVTRKSPEPGEEGWVINEKERLSRRQALECYTINNAYMTFEEDEKGSIEPGKLADMIVISKDLMKCPEDEIRKINVDMTIVGGKSVYQHEAESPYPEHPYFRE